MRRCVRCGIKSNSYNLLAFCDGCMRAENITNVWLSSTEDAFYIKRADGSKEALPREALYDDNFVYHSKPKVIEIERGGADKWPIRRCGAHGNPDIPAGPCTCQW
jgi:hypothetical protein